MNQLWVVLRMLWNKLIFRLSATAALLLLASCVTVPPETARPVADSAAMAEQPLVEATPEPILPSFYREPPPEESEQEPQTMIKKGSGQFVAKDAAQPRSRYRRGDITLNFNLAELSEFVRVVFEKILKKNYLIDPRVKGTVTLHTSNPIHEQSILPILETVLHQNSAALVLQDGIYKIVPVQEVLGQISAPRVGSKLASGSTYAMQIVPLRFVSAKEMEKVLKPMMPKDSLLIDEARNLLVLSGPRHRLQQMLDTIAIFDVDWFEGMSFGLFRLQYAEANGLVEDLQSVIGTDGSSPLAGIVRLTPIERLNAILVVSHAPRYIDEISQLINQFDWGVEGSPGQRLYVYHLKYSKADKLASVLQQIYELDNKDQASRPANTLQLPPGERDNFSQPTQTLNSPPASAGRAIADAGFTAGGEGEPVARPVESAAPAVARADEKNPDLATQANINIIPEPDSNSLLIMASPQDYRGIETVIKQLDIPPRQVLIEANIAEVTLSDSLAYGVRWFLTNGASEFGFNAPVPVGAGGAGLTAATFSTTNDARAFIDLLATKTAVNFLSAPQVMVLDNQTASIRVGDQIPVTVRSSQSTGDGNSPVVSEVQFRDTGTLLSVTPSINAGGQIQLEISQEVSVPGADAAPGGGGNVAISQRTIESSVVVQSGETVLLGGLILETKNAGRSGIPLLMDIPWLGNLFSTTSDVIFRTELIVMITPRVVESPTEMRAIVDEVRGKMKKAVEYGNSVESVDL